MGVQIECRVAALYETYTTSMRFMMLETRPFRSAASDGAMNRTEHLAYELNAGSQQIT